MEIQASSVCAPHRKSPIGRDIIVCDDPRTGGIGGNLPTSHDRDIFEKKLPPMTQEEAEQEAKQTAKLLKFIFNPLGSAIDVAKEAEDTSKTESNPLASGAEVAKEVSDKKDVKKVESTDKEASEKTDEKKTESADKKELSPLEKFLVNLLMSRPKIVIHDENPWLHRHDPDYGKI